MEENRAGKERIDLASRTPVNTEKPPVGADVAENIETLSAQNWCIMWDV